MKKKSLSLNKGIKVFLIIGVLFSAYSLPANPENSDSKTPTIVFKNANVIPMNHERILENHSVFVKDGKIVQLCPARIVDYYQNVKKTRNM